MRKQSKTEKELKDLLENLTPSSFRYQVLLVAKNFKSNWMDLGEHLKQLAQSEEYKSWGYGSLEDFCKKEIRVKWDTAQKLMMSYQYLKSHRPKLLDPQNITPPPDFKTIDQLAQLEESKVLPKEDFEMLQEKVLDQGISPSSLKKQIKAVTQGEEKDGPSEEAQLIDKLKNSLTTVKRLLPIFQPEPQVFDALEQLMVFLEGMDESDDEGEK